MNRRSTGGVASILALAAGVALLAPDARSQGKVTPSPLHPDPRPAAPQISACTQLLQQGGVKIDLVATPTSSVSVQLTWQGPAGVYEVKSTSGTGFQASVKVSEPRFVQRGAPALLQGSAAQTGAQPDFQYDYTITGTLLDGRKACGSANAKTPPAPALPYVKGRTLAGPKTDALSGWADLHTHPMSNLAFAGRIFRGGVDNEARLGVDSKCRQLVKATGMGDALGPDNSCGDVIRKNLLAEMQGKDGLSSSGDGSGGAPSFTDWPKWNDISHQKMWFEWLRRARDGGLRVMVALAHNNKALAVSVAANGDPPVDDRSSANLQITEMTAFIGRHGDFMEVAKSPADVARIARSNRIAVVLGMEVDNINNGDWAGGEASVTAEIQRLYDQGVRYVFPVHLTNNAFGATALYSQQFNLAGFYQNRQWWDVECAACSDEITWNVPSANFDVPLDAVRLIKLGVQPWENPPAPPACLPVVQCGAVGHRNKLGMTKLGEHAIKEMMKRGMLIDIDHMSDKTANRALEIAESVTNGYPLVSGHSGLRNRSQPGPKPSSAGMNGENSRLPAQLQRIAKLGGMFGIGTDGIDAYAWAKAYSDAMVPMGNRQGSVAFGTDMNSLVKSPRPSNRDTVSYDASFPAPKSTDVGAAGKTWSYKTDGVAHYGMMADFVKDVKTAPGGATVDASLFRSADYFWHMWERCEAQKANVK